MNFPEVLERPSGKTKYSQKFGVTVTWISVIRAGWPKFGSGLAIPTERSAFGQLIYIGDKRRKQREKISYPHFSQILERLKKNHPSAKSSEAFLSIQQSLY